MDSPALRVGLCLHGTENGTSRQGENIMSPLLLLLLLCIACSGSKMIKAAKLNDHIIHIFKVKIEIILWCMAASLIGRPSRGFSATANLTYVVPLLRRLSTPGVCRVSSVFPSLWKNTERISIKFAGTDHSTLTY